MTLQCSYTWMILVCLGWLIGPVYSSEPQPDKNIRSKSPSTQPSAVLPRPRLLITESEREPFRQKMARSIRLGKGWDYIQKADTRSFDQSAFVAFVNNDSKLADECIHLLLNVGPSTSAQLDSSYPPLSHWGNVRHVASTTEKVAIAYDLLYTHMTEGQRKSVRRLLIQNGIQPLINNCFTFSAPATRPARPIDPVGISSVGLAALAVLDEEPKAADWLRKAHDSLKAILSNTFIDQNSEYFAQTGCWPSVLAFMEALYRCTGENLFEKIAAQSDILIESAAWRALAWREKSTVKSASLIESWTFSLQPSSLSVLCAMLIKHKHSSTAAWLAERMEPVPRDIRELVWTDESIPSYQPGAVKPVHVIPQLGQVIIRNGWGPDTPAAAISFRSTDDIHSIGSFDLFGANHPTFVNSGRWMWRESLDRPIDHQATPVSPNVIIVDGRDRKKATGIISAAIGTSRLSAASVQLSAAYPDALKSWTRDLIMLPGNLAIVLDRLEAKGQHRFDYVLHPHPPFKTPYPNASPGEILIGDDDQPTRASLFSEAPFSVSQVDAFGIGSSRMPYLRFDSAELTSNRSYLMVCQWPSAAVFKQHSVDVAAIGAGRWQVRRISDDWRLIIRTGKDASDTDVEEARLVAVWDQGEKSRERHALALAARRLGIDNNELMRTTKPIYAAIEFGRPLWAHFWAAEPTRVALTVDPGTNHAFLNGKPLEIAHRGSTICFDLPAGESTMSASDIPRYIPRLPRIVNDDLLPVSSNTPVLKN